MPTEPEIIKEKPSIDNSSKEILPALGTLPKTENYYLPQEIVFALSKLDQSPHESSSKPPKDVHAIKNLTGSTRKRPDNVWHYKRREKFKHLTDNTVCICGSGKDISFLYDALPPDKSEIYFRDLENKMAQKKTDDKLQLPFELCPDEYYFVSKKGVKSLKIQDETYKTLTEDHTKHLTQFPSLKPNSRFEVIKLRNAMHNMLNKAGMNEDSKSEDGLTQMHNLLELVRKEQDIYNVVFHEIIRQVSVDCIERGDLLAEIRQRYLDLLNRVPEQIKSLYEEVLSQRALDRRLTDELIRFKRALIQLSEELACVKAQDIKLTEEINTTRKALKTALSESAKNANMLKEYQELYDLQRHRLEKQVNNTTQERDLWCKTTYNLAIKVIEEGDLLIAKRLIIYEKQWAKICQHYTVTLSDIDTSHLIIIQGLLEVWKVHMEQYFLDISQWEEKSSAQLKALRADIGSYITHFTENLENNNGTTDTTHNLRRLDDLFKKMIYWDQILMEENVNYFGELPLTRMEKLGVLIKLQAEWQGLCFKLLVRHQPSQTQKTKMDAAFEKITYLMKEMKVQNEVLITGENGTAKGISRLSEKLNGWIKKLNNSVKDPKLFDPQEDDNLLEILSEINDAANNIVNSFGMVETRHERIYLEPKRRISIFNVVNCGNHLYNIVSSIIDSQDAKLVDQVTQLHLKIIMWMCHLLIHLCPDRESSSKETLEVLYSTYPSPKEVMQEGISIFPVVETLTEKIARDITDVREITKEFPSDAVYDLKTYGKLTRQFSMDENDDGFEIEQMKVDCEKWIYSAKLLLSDILKEPLILTFPNVEKQQSKIENSFAEDTNKPVISECLEKLNIPRKDEGKMQEHGVDHSDGVLLAKPPDTLPLPSSRAGSFPEETSKSDSARKSIAESSQKDSKFVDTGATKAPEATKKPAGIKVRKTSKVLEAAKTSETTKMPEATKTPEATKAAKATKTHEATKATKAIKTHESKAIKSSEGAKAAKTPEVSEASERTESSDEAKVSEGNETGPDSEAEVIYVSVSTQTVSQLTYSEYRMEQLSKLKKLESKKSLQGYTQSLDNISRISSDITKQSSSLIKSKTEIEDDIIEVIGSDGHTLSQTLEYSKHQIPAKPSLLEADLKAPDTNKAYIALCTVKMLQEQLVATEKRAQEYENRADIAEFELIQLQGKLQAMTKIGKDLNTSAILISDKITESTSLPSTQTGKALKKSLAKTPKSKKK
ncbi:axonemal dynein light chain domain-containing protein 1 [Octopus bimaculoides]|nr:axonemal dynein light chain domain-containing protein 1 [Octopus bimaculoides]XP_014776299.1 axonemal dynein light chain domain-containing protein 1 [Octopus bimaculoides]|eukprot:XP_014776298.1 PREDICTED: axonemal dynein light chain domain-containing protein 1-like isoform X2 [Octopus bimaculoides]